jgi:hypothetical protein
MRTAIPLTVLATALACSLATAPANARARVFVASYGNDANPCTFGSPCKTFQVAVNAVDAGGEVTAIDSAGFGPISINKSVTITSPNGVEAGIVVSNGGDGIDISGSGAVVVLRGLTLEGDGFGANGISLTSGAGLTITNCVVKDFNIGVSVEPNDGSIDVIVTDTIISGNQIGFLYEPAGGSPTALLALSHVTATNNVDTGLLFDGRNSASTNVAIADSFVSENSSGIVTCCGASLIISIDNTTVHGNGLVGIHAQTPSRVLLSRSVIQGNRTGIGNATANSFFTYGNNLIDLNANNIDVPLNTSVNLR